MFKYFFYWDNFNFVLSVGNDEYVYAAVLVQFGQAESANYSYSELSYVLCQQNCIDLV